MDIDSLKFDEKGLIPAIIQDINTQVVLMQEKKAGIICI